MIDISKEFITIAERRVPGASFFVLDMRDVATLGTMFDGVFAQASLLHIPKREASTVIGALTAVLQPGGLFYCAVKEIRPGQNVEEVAKEDDYGYSYERFFSYYSQAEIEQTCIELGLTLVSSEVARSGKTNWIHVIAKKPIV